MLYIKDVNNYRHEVRRTMTLQLGPIRMKPGFRTYADSVAPDQPEHPDRLI